MDRKYINSADYLYERPILLYDLLEEANDVIDDIYDKIEESKKDNLQIKIKYHNPDMPKLKLIDKGEWIDLYTDEDVTLKQGEFKLISLGVSMRLPEGYEANIVPRSSTFKNFGILQTNSYGVIDSSFSGDNDVWKFPALAFRDITIPKFSRICQFRINKTMKSNDNILFEEVEHLGNNNRGGFGSSGTAAL